MPTIPDGAKTPSDHNQSDALTAEAAPKPDGWELLRPWGQVRFFEKTELASILASIDINERNRIQMTAKSIKVIGDLAQLLETTFALDRDKFRDWVEKGEFEDQISRVIDLAFPYSNHLGEANRSAS